MDMSESMIAVEDRNSISIALPLLRQMRKECPRQSPCIRMTRGGQIKNQLVIDGQPSELAHNYIPRALP